MRVYRVVLVCLCLVLFSSNAAAQKLEVLGGYSYTNADFSVFNSALPSGSASVSAAHGWMAGVTYFLNEEFALTGQFSVHRGSEVFASSIDAEATLRLYAGGIRFHNDAGPVQVGINLMAGGMDTSVETAAQKETSSSIAVLLGVFVDLPLNSFGVRLFQGDVIFSSEIQDNPALRVSFGAFYRW